MAEIVNLNRARKARERDQARRAAAENRILHGRTKAERNKTEAERRAQARALDGHRREDGDGG